VFTGIIEGKGKVLNIEYKGEGKRLSIELPTELTDVQLGDSINLNGACLTIVEKRGSSITVDLSGETLQRTNLSWLKEGDWVNLERALRLSDRLGGHLVTGHIDGMGEIVEKVRQREFYLLKIRIPSSMGKYIVPKGSVAIDGVSLTVNETEGDIIQITLIPYTIEKTTLADRKVGDPVNIETDILGKYVEKMLGDRGGEKGFDLNFLKEHGFIKEE